MIPDNLLEAASFAPVSLYPPNAWIGHLPFAAWLIREVSPGIFVELGTHSGNSYFSFCQSVAESGIAVKCFAIDTWQGDLHAGEYGNEVFARVDAHNSEFYAGFSRLMRTTFDSAATQFRDGSIGLLHVDGLHTYDAVRHDFDTWLPKLAPGAVVIFHDTQVRERNFGVWKLWEELRAVYVNNLELLHSHGLGILQLNDAPNDKKLDWLRPGSPAKQELIHYFAALGSRQLERFELFELKRHVEHLSLAMENLNLVIASRDTQIAALDRTIAAIYDSNSWRLLKPLRIFRGWLTR